MNRVRCPQSAIIAVLGLLATLACRQPVTRPGEHLITFSLEDQFGQTTTRADLAGATSLVIVADRAAREQATAWGAEALKRWPDAIADRQLVVLRVAHLGPFPKALKSIVKSQLPKDPNQPVLMDWSGAFATYGLEAGRVLVLTFDAEGKLIARQRGETPASDSGQGLLAQVARCCRRETP